MMTFFEKLLDIPLIRKYEAMIKFGAVGLFNLFLNYFVFYTLIFAFIIPNDLMGQKIPMSIANFITWVITVISSYFLNSKMTFKHELSWSKLAQFMIASSFGLLVDMIVLNIASSFMDLHFAKLVAIIFAFMANYFLSKKYVFGDKK